MGLTAIDTVGSSSMSQFNVSQEYSLQERLPSDLRPQASKLQVRYVKKRCRYYRTRGWSTFDLCAVSTDDVDTADNRFVVDERVQRQEFPLLECLPSD